MGQHQPFQIIGYHSCDKEIGLKVLNGEMDLQPSENMWDWLGHGIYFWEQNPKRALEYAEEVKTGAQFNKKKITTPFVLGAIIQLGNCLNLLEANATPVLQSAYEGMKKVLEQAGKPMPINNNNNRRLDCDVIRFAHASNKDAPYDTVRTAFDEGEGIYPGATFTSRHHIQVCVLNHNLIKGYFLPRPLKEFNPYL